jgi:hypothetical protein
MMTSGLCDRTRRTRTSRIIRARKVGLGQQPAAERQDVTQLGSSSDLVEARARNQGADNGDKSFHLTLPSEGRTETARKQ